MSHAVLFISWNRPHPGMEDQAYGYLMESGLQYLKKEQGKYFERLETIALTAHGGETNGCVLLFGDRAKLDELRRTDDFEAFAMKLGSYMDKLAVVPGLSFEGIQAVMARRKARG